MADLEAIIQQQVDTQIHGKESEDSGDGGDTTTETTETQTETPERIEAQTTESQETKDPQKDEAAKKALEEAEDLFAKEHGLVDKAGKRENRIPYPRVKKITENAVANLVKNALGLDGLPPDKKAADVLKEHVGRIPKLEEEVGKYKTEIESVNAVGEMMQNDPDRFLALLPHINPKYSELLMSPADREKYGQVVGRLNGGMPEPDLDMGEGRKTYSPDGLRALMTWQAQQTRDEVLKEVQKDLKPIKDRDQISQVQSRIVQQLREKVANAKANWKGFAENESAILNAVKSGLNLESAYQKVMFDTYEKKLTESKADREKMRKELLDEIEKAPSSTSVVNTSKSKKSNEDEPSGDLEDVIRAAWKNRAGA